MSLKRPGQRRRGSCGNKCVPDDSCCTCKADPRDERGDTPLVCLPLLFQLKVHGKELLGLWWWCCGCGVVEKEWRREGRKAEREKLLEGRLEVM